MRKKRRGNGQIWEAEEFWPVFNQKMPPWSQMSHPQAGESKREKTKKPTVYSPT